MDAKNFITASERIRDQRKSLYCSVLSQLLSEYSCDSLYDSIVSSSIDLSIPASNIPDEIDSVKSKNRELSDMLSNRLTGLMYFIEELIEADEQSRLKAPKANSHESHNSNKTQNPYSNVETPVGDQGGELICREIASLMRLNKLKEEELGKNQREVIGLDEKFTRMVEDLESTLNVKRQGIVEDLSINTSCKCQII